MTVSASKDLFAISKASKRPDTRWLRFRWGRACRLCPGRSDVNLFRYREGIIDLDAQVSDSAFDLRVNPAAAGRLLGFREVFTGLFRGDFQIVIDRLPRVLGQPKHDWVAGFPLTHCGAIDGVASRSSMIILLCHRDERA